MINKLVQLRDGRTICRVLDSIIYNGNTLYLVIDFNTRSVTTIIPKDIHDIMELDVENNFISIKNIIAEKGL
jgi:hypothetical protein